MKADAEILRRAMRGFIYMLIEIFDKFAPSGEISFLALRILTAPSPRVVQKKKKTSDRATRTDKLSAR